MKAARPFLALGTALLLAGTGGAQDWRTEFSYTWADNLSRTSYPPDRLAATLLDGAVTADWHRQLAPDWSALVTGEAGFEQVRAFPGLDSVHLGGRVELRKKFGLGPFAPVLAFGGGAARYDLHEDGRSLWRVDAGASLSQRLTESWRIVASGSWNEDYAKAHPFDIRNLRVSLETTWDVRDGWQLGAGASHLWGELTANANTDIFQHALHGGLGPAVANYYGRVAYGPSWSFGDDWVAYRINCRANFWWLGLTISLGENTSLPLRYETVRVVNRVDVSYTSDFWSLSIVHRF
jgi:hypothetical protein